MTSTRFILQRQSHGLDRMVANDALKLLSIQRLALYEHLSHCGVERRIAGQGRAGRRQGLPFQKCCAKAFQWPGSAPASPQKHLSDISKTSILNIHIILIYIIYCSIYSILIYSIYPWIS